MPVEAATFVDDLVVTNPPSGDPVSQGDDHLRLIKAVLRETFPNGDKPFWFPNFESSTITVTLTESSGSKIVNIDATSGNLIVNLPTDIDSNDDGWSCLIMKSDGTANTVTIIPPTGTINGAATYVLRSQWDGVMIVWPGTDHWRAFFGRQAIATGDLADAAVTNAKLADVATQTVKGRVAGGSGPPTDLSMTQLTTLLNVVTTSLRGAAPAIGVNDAADGKVLTAGAAWGFSGAPHASFSDQKAAGTDGGTFTSGSWATRTLQTTYRNVNSFATLASNQISLPAGDYFIEWSAPAYQAGRHQTQLWNASDAVLLGSGSSEVAGAGDTTSTRSTGKRQISLAGTKLIELQHQCATTAATSGLGLAANFGITEVYAWLNIFRL